MTETKRRTQTRCQIWEVRKSLGPRITRIGTNKNTIFPRPDRPGKIRYPPKRRIPDNSYWPVTSLFYLTSLYPLPDSLIHRFASYSSPLPSASSLSCRLNVKKVQSRNFYNLLFILSSACPIMKRKNKPKTPPE
jgi:hypothetical protein